jgi:hypothetical protein
MRRVTWKCTLSFQLRSCEMHSHHQPHVTNHTSHVTRHTSHVTNHTSHVTNHTSHVTNHTSHPRYPADCRAQFFFDVFECILFIFYAFELTLRVLAFGLSGFSKGWILFDSLLVIIGSVFYIVSYSTNIALDPGAASSLRIIRIARVSVVL